MIWTNTNAALKGLLDFGRRLTGRRINLSCARSTDTVGERGELLCVRGAENASAHVNNSDWRAANKFH